MFLSRGRCLDLLIPMPERKRLLSDAVQNWPNLDNWNRNFIICLFFHYTVVQNKLVLFFKNIDTKTEFLRNIALPLLIHSVG